MTGTLGRRAFAVALALLAPMALAACSSGDDESADGQVAIKLGYWAEAGAPADATMRDLVQQFENENPGITVKVESAAYDEYYTRLRTQVAGGNAPDVWLNDGAFLQEYAGRNSLRDLDSYMDETLAGSTYGLDLVRGGDARKRLFGFPMGAQTAVLFYNKKLLADAGVAPPTDKWTYDDVLQAATRLTKDTNGDGKPDVYGFRAYSKSFTESWWPMVKAYGGQILDDSGRAAVSSPASQDALTWMLTAMYDRKVSPDVVTTEALGGSQTLFPSGVVAMQFGLYARIQTASQGKVDFGVARLPLGPKGRGEIANVNSWGINSRSSGAKADAAWKWIQFFAGARAQTAWSKIGEAMPINKSVAASKDFLEPGTPPDNRQVFLDALAEADDLDLNPVWNEYTSAITKAVTSGLSRETPVPEALTTAQAQAQQAIDRFKPSA